MQYIITDYLTGATTRIQEIRLSATTDSQWLPAYDTYTLTIENPIINKAAYIYITGLTNYYTAGEISGATDLSRDWYLLGFRPVSKTISNCPQTGLARKVYLRNLNIDSGEVLTDLTQPVSNQKITGYYNIITLALDGTVYASELHHFELTSPLTLTTHDYYFGAGIAAQIMVKFDDLFGN